MPTSVKELLASANESVPRVSHADAQKMLKGGALLVDLRDTLELQQGGKIKGAKHVSRGMLEFRADPESPYYDPAFEKTKPVILYCASGGRSALAGKTLKEFGYERVFNLGAFKDWAEAGLPTEPA